MEHNKEAVISVKSLIHATLEHTSNDTGGSAAHTNSHISSQQSSRLVFVCFFLKKIFNERKFRKSDKKNTMRDRVSKLT
jgi:hypothetical protein